MPTHVAEKAQCCIAPPGRTWEVGQQDKKKRSKSPRDRAPPFLALGPPAWGRGAALFTPLPPKPPGRLWWWWKNRIPKSWMCPLNLDTLDDTHLSPLLFSFFNAWHITQHRTPQVVQTISIELKNWSNFSETQIIQHGEPEKKMNEWIFPWIL